MSTKHIDTAILAAQRSVAPLAKSSKANIKGKQPYSYAFVPGEQIVAHGLEALHENGVSWETSWEPHNFGGGTWLKLTVRLSHPESGEVAERFYYMPVKGRGDADKAVAGALTYCKGYAMAALCGIVREDEAQQQPDRRGEELGQRNEPDYRPADPVVIAKQTLGRYAAELAKVRGCQIVDARKAIFEEHHPVSDKATLADYEQWIDAAKALIVAAKKAVEAA